MKGIDLYWLPLGAGEHSVRLNGRIFARTTSSPCTSMAARLSSYMLRAAKAHLFVTDRPLPAAPQWIAPAFRNDA